MADVTSGTDSAPRAVRTPLRFGTITVVGGGCYGGYYVRQLARAHAAGAAEWEHLVVVDRDPDCAVSRLVPADRPEHLRVEVSEWGAYFGEYLDSASTRPELHAADAIVPSPLMPHLMAEWILARAVNRWPGRSIAVAPFENRASSAVAACGHRRDSLRQFCRVEMPGQLCGTGAVPGHAGRAHLEPAANASAHYGDEQRRGSGA